jgi:hypothetical protein
MLTPCYGWAVSLRYRIARYHDLQILAPSPELRAQLRGSLSERLALAGTVSWMCRWWLGGSLGRREWLARAGRPF